MHTTVRTDRNELGRTGGWLAQCHRRMLIRLALCAAFLAPLDNAPAEVKLSAESRSRAVFLVRFAQFVQWPKPALGPPGAPVIIGVLGSDPFGSQLDELAAAERLNGRPLTVKRFKRVDEVDDCHVLYVSGSEPARLRRVLRRLEGRPILTVGDAQDFAMLGGMIQFVTENERVRFRVDREAVERSGLKLSSKLLRAADGQTLEEP